jgi:asparagine synthase (glutamine-hydrolysing)
MCGILCIFGARCKCLPTGTLNHRGPDMTANKQIGKCEMFFDRLAINDTSESGMQPFTDGDSMLMCNGEIYNHGMIEHPFTASTSDCECLLYLVKKFGIIETSRMIRGEFAICYSDGEKVMASRDPFGVRPLFYTYYDNDNKSIAFASEMKALSHFDTKIHIFPPGHAYDSSTDKFTCYYPYEWNIKEALMEAVRIRVENAQRPLGFLLSGGLDSSLVVAIAKKYISSTIKTFSVGIDDSPDVLAARKMAAFLGSDHTEFRFNVEDGIRHLEDVIWSLESYDTTTVRASVPMWLLSQFISKNSDCKVILSGEGSDELFGGYLYFHYAPDVEAFEAENTRRLRLIHQFDGLRADRCIAAHGLELRVPFLDVNVVHSGMVMDQRKKMPIDGIEKHYLRKSFEGFIPDEILWRQKNGMSDAVGYEWVKRVKSYADSVITDEEFETIKSSSKGHNVPLTKEEALYRKIFWKHFGTDKDHLISEIWRPKWTDQTDPSATQLNVFTKA